MSSREYAAWRAYERVEPIGEDRADIRAALVANTVARAHGHKTQIRDFLVDYWRDPGEAARLAGENLVARLRLFARAHNRSLTK